MIQPGSFAIVGAAESTEIGTVPQLSSMGLALDGAVNALNDAGLKASDIDGLTVAHLPVGNVVQQLGLYPRWVDGASIGGCSWMFHLHSAIAAINVGYCSTVLIIDGESGRSHGSLPSAYDVGRPGSIEQQFDLPYTGASLSASLFGQPLARYMAIHGLTEAQLAKVTACCACLKRCASCVGRRRRRCRARGSRLSTAGAASSRPAPR